MLIWSQRLVDVHKDTVMIIQTCKTSF